MAESRQRLDVPRDERLRRAGGDEPRQHEALDGDVRPRDAVTASAGLECVLLAGLPGAGKTTFYQRYFAATHRHISKDLWPNATARESRQRRLLEEALMAGVPVVVDNTNPTIADRSAVIAIAHACGARVVGYFFDVTTRQAVARNAGRTGRGKVPNVAIFTVAKRFEPPTLAEGYDQLFRVTFTDDRRFSIAELQ